MKVRSVVAMTLALAACVASRAAIAATYTYKVEHPKFGEIGTYADTVERYGDRLSIETSLHLEVRALGVRVYREEGYRVASWEGDRLVSFYSRTDTNGEGVEVHGEADGDVFQIDGPAGRVTAPANVQPSNPWAVKAGNGVMMASKTGRLEAVYVTSSSTEAAGGHASARVLRVSGAQRQQIWLDRQGVPVRFRIEEDGTPVDFNLIQVSGASGN